MTPRRCIQTPQGAAATAAVAHSAAVPVLHTDRLCLRAPRIDDLPVWTQIYTAPDAKHFGGPFSEETAWEQFAYYTGGWMLYGHGLWAVERKDDAATIGFVHLGLEWDDDEPELGWMFAHTARGRGYAVESGRAARDYGFTLFDTFVSYIAPGNIPSNQVAARLAAKRDPNAESTVNANTLALGDNPINVWRYVGRLTT